jgi:predicted transcriptional regulator
MLRRGKGRPHKGERNIVAEVLEAIPRDGSYIRVNELREKTKMSSTTLTKGLLYLKEMGIIDRRHSFSGRAIGTEYGISPDFGWINLHRDNRCKNLDKIMQVVDKLILELFRQYYSAEDTQKEMIFDANLSIIIRFLKLCKTL